MAPPNIDDVLTKTAAQANATLLRGEDIHLSAHMLRHTALRKVAKQEDMHYARKLSGHTSSRDSRGYTGPSREEQEWALENLF